MSSLRSFTRSLLDLVGLLRLARGVRRWIEEQQYWLYYSQRNSYEVKICGRKFVFSTEDRYSGRWFFPRYSKRIHEPKATELWVRVAQKSRGIIDVGANLGWFTCIAASISDGTVHAFELDEENLSRLRANLALNELENVKVNHAAIADSEGHVSYRKKAGTAGVGYSFARRDRDRQEQIRVKATTLDRYIKEKCQSVNLIKIDVEGSEQQVLEGARRTIQEFCPHILLEVHPALLEPTGTSIKTVLGEFPDTYRVYHVEDFRWAGQETNWQCVDSSKFAPRRTSMFYAEPPNDSLNNFPAPRGLLYEIC